MKKQILLVDDQVSFCHHIKAVLEQEGYEVAVANSADQALQLLSFKAFDILLTDMKMPGVDGLELFKMARKADPDISGIIMRLLDPSLPQCSPSNTVSPITCKSRSSRKRC